MRKTIALVVALLLTMALKCEDQNTGKTDTTKSDTTKSDTIETKPVEIVLRVSGAAHLADEMNPPVIIIPNFTEEAHPHTALIAAVTEFVAPGGLPNQRDRIEVDNNNHVQSTVGWGELPAGVEIDLAKSGVTSLTALSMDNGDASSDACPTPHADSTTPPTSLRWLPRLWKIAKASGPFALKESFTRKDPCPDVVTARLEVKGGTLEAELAPQVRKFAFRIGGQRANDDVVQAVSTSLVYRFSVDLPTNDPVFTLKGRRFGTDGSRDEDFVVLGKFKPLDGRDRIEIDLVNLPVDEFFNLSDSHTLRHFDLHYRIVKGEHNEALPELVELCSNGNRPLYECGPTH